jgi:hypothetical protein
MEEYANCQYDIQGRYFCKKPIRVEDTFAYSPQQETFANPPQSGGVIVPTDFASPLSKNLFGKCYNDQSRTNNLANIFKISTPIPSSDPDNMYNYDPLNPKYSNWYLDIVASDQNSYTFEIKCKSDESTKTYLQQLSQKPSFVMKSLDDYGPKACPPTRLPLCTSQTSASNHPWWCKAYPVKGVYFVYKMSKNPTSLTEMKEDPYLKEICNLQDATQDFDGNKVENTIYLFSGQLIRPEKVFPSLSITLGSWSKPTNAPPVIKIKIPQSDSYGTTFRVGDQIKLTATNPRNFDCLKNAKGQFQYAFMSPDPFLKLPSGAEPNQNVTHYWCPVDLTAPTQPPTKRFS